MDPIAIEAAIREWLALRGAGAIAEADRLSGKVLADLGSAAFEVLHGLGVEEARRENSTAAVEILGLALTVDPASAPACCHLGIAFHQLGRHADALASYERALELRPGYATALSNRGVTLYDMKRYWDAVESYDRAILADPGHSQAHFNRGNALHALARHEDALASYDRALEIDPAYAKALVNRGNALHALARHEEALESYDRALALTKDTAEAEHNRGTALRALGDVPAAIQSYRSALSRHPGEPRTHSALIFNLMRTSADPDEVYGQCRAFEAQFAAGVPRLPHRNAPDPDRRLKVGYVSADFREHPIGWHIEPILVHHDARTVEAYCYAAQSGFDRMTQQVKRAGGHWRQVADLPDDALAALVQEDGIDILVDLSGHTAGNRLLAFARKPAPVQVTWLGLPATTGLSSIDYRLTDALIDPPGTTEGWHGESLVRLSTHACYRPPDLPAVTGLPALSSGHVTFASFNEFDKLSPVTCALWAKLLARVPDAKLLVVCNQPAVKMLRKRFASLGVDAGRLDFMDRLPRDDYLKLHGAVDILLDPFPFNGGTVTRNALWMGVPAITLAGVMPYSRVGLALLSEAGLPSFVAQSEEEYVEIALRWANDLPGLVKVRRTLRQAMQRAPSNDAAACTRELESAYRRMWTAWCAGRVSGTTSLRDPSSA